MPTLRSFALMLVAVTATCTAAALGAGELTLQGAFTSGSYGTDSDTDAKAMVLRYVTGNKYQFLVQVPYLDLDAASPVTPGPIGPIPRRRRAASGSGGSMGQAGDGQGSGSQSSSGQASDGQGPGDGGPGDEPPVELPPPGLERVNGLGDITLGLSARVLGGGAKIYWLSADAGVKLPTGDADKNLGTGETDFRVGASGEYRFWTVTGFGGAGWTFYGDPEWGPLADGLDAWAGLESLPLADRFVVSGWLSANQEVVAGAGSRATASVGFRTVGRWRWRASFTAGLTEAAEDFRAQVGVSFGVEVPTAGRRGSWR